MKKSRRSSLLTNKLLAALLAAAAPSVHAATNTWKTTALDGLWANTGNWSLNALNTTDNIVFGSSNFTTLSTGTRTIADMTFSSVAPAYTINGTDSSQILTLTQSGSNVNCIINNSPNTQTIGVNLSLATSKSYVFGTNAATNSPTSTVINGTTFFGGNGTQSNAAIINARGVNVTISALQSTAVSTAQTQALVLDGNTSDSKVLGVIANNSTGAGLSTTAIAKAGTGTWSLSGANTYTGGTSIQNGTLKLDFATSGAPTADILYNGVTPAVVYLSGGSLLIAGADNKNNIQNLSSLGLSSGYPFTGAATVKLTNGTSGTTKLNLTSLSNTTGSNTGLINFDISSGSTINVTTLSTFTNTFVGSTYTYGETQFAYYSGTGTTRQITTAVDANYSLGRSIQAGDTGNATTNAFYYLKGSMAATTNFGYGGLRISNNANSDTLDMGGKSLQGNNGNILYAGGSDNKYTITNGIISNPGYGGNTQITVATGATLNVSSTADITNNSSGTTVLTKQGGGTLNLAGAKTFTGALNIANGTYTFDNIAIGGTASGLGASTNAAANLWIGGTLKYTGANATTDRGFTVMGTGATIDSSGSGALTWAPFALAYSASSNSYGAGKTAANNSITFTGTNTNDNTFGSATALLADGSPGQLSVTKSGTGKWILSGANTYTGGTTVTGGTLVFGNAFTMNGPNAITVAATGTAGTDYATVTSTTSKTLTFAGTLNINLTASLGGSASFNLFQSSGGTLAGSFTAVSVTGSYLASLTNSAGIWSGSGSGYDFSFAQSTGILTATSAIPEPATYAALVGLGILGLAIYRRRQA